MSDLNIHKMKRADFLALPSRKWSEDIGEFTSLVIIPMRHKHDSGYACMDFVACRGDKPICLLSGCSDVIHIGGIGGLGEWIDGKWPNQNKRRSWSIDCLYKSKLLRLFSDGNLTCSDALSSFDVFSKGKNDG